MTTPDTQARELLAAEYADPGCASLMLSAHPTDDQQRALRAIEKALRHPNEEVERLLTLIETADEHGDEMAIVEQAAKVRAALASTPSRETEA